MSFCLEKVTAQQFHASLTPILGHLRLGLMEYVVRQLPHVGILMAGRAPLGDIPACSLFTLEEKLARGTFAA